MLILATVNSYLLKSPQFLTKRPIQHVFILLTALIISIALYILLAHVAKPLDAAIGPFMMIWLVCFLFYFVACIWVMKTKPLSGRWLWSELGIIFAGAFIFRVILLPLPLGLSRDAWRYLWDARVIMHGYNPYLYAPLDKVLVPLRDIVYANCPYRELPTKYTPGAELFFVLGYLLMQTNLLALKGLFVLCDLLTCGSLAILLTCKKLDPRRVIIYAWCPLPIVEFAIQGHVDAIAIALTVLAVLCAVSSRRHMRILAGVFIGLATLAKLYPIILLIALIRRRDWDLLVACAVTIVLGYLPFILSSHGQPLAVILSFVGQREAHIGVMQNVILIIGHNLGIELATSMRVIHVLEVALLWSVVLIVVVQRLRKRMSVVLAVLLLTGGVLTIYAHVFPWYAAAFLPWIALLVEPIWSARGFSPKGLAMGMIWYFTCTVIISYIPGLKQFFTTSNWLIYYGITFGVVLIGLVIAATIVLVHYRVSFSARSNTS